MKLPFSFLSIYFLSISENPKTSSLFLPHRFSPGRPWSCATNHFYPFSALIGGSIRQRQSAAISPGQLLGPISQPLRAHSLRVRKSPVKFSIFAKSQKMFATC
jgi:hypothetical protein